MIRIRNPEKIKQLLSQEKDLKVKQKLSFLNLVANHHLSVKEATQALGIAISTGYKWVRDWNTKGYQGLLPSSGKRGRPPRLKEKDLERLRELLSQKDGWTTKEVCQLIREEFQVELSYHQVRRILKYKLKMRLCKPYVKDYRRPSDAEERLDKAVQDVLEELREEGYTEEEIGIGFVDEFSPPIDG